MKALAGQAARFGAVGLFNTGLGLCAIWAAMLLGLPALMANAVGYLIGLVISFTLNRRWTFPDGEVELAAAAPRFLLAFALAWAANAFVLSATMRASQLSPYLLQILGMAVYTAVFFCLCRAWVFRGAAARSVPGE